MFDGVGCMLLQMSDGRLLVKGVVVLYKANVDVTIDDLSVHTSHLDSLPCRGWSSMQFRRWRRHTEWLGKYEMCNAPS